MNQEIRNQLIAAVWATLDVTDGDEGVVRDEVELAIDAWSPQDADDDR